MKNRKIILPFLLFLHNYFQSYCQELPLFKNENLYIFARGTRSKSSFISKGFNLIDSNITHIGIGLYERPSQKYPIVYNVSNVNKKSVLLRQSITEFFNEPDIFYGSIWVLKTDKATIRKISENILTYQNKVIRFDYDFSLSNADTLIYCSEFVWKVINKMDKNLFYKPLIRRLDQELLIRFLKKTMLEYIPVDFFLEIKGVKRIYEKMFKY